MTTHLLPAYARTELAFERGEGAWLIATDGQRYLDFASGVAVNALGHAHPHVVEAITEQAKRLLHVSNLYRIPEGERLADRLCAASFADTVFFCNSGAEAMECVIKMVRKYQSANGHPGRYRIVTFDTVCPDEHVGSFGRLLGQLFAEIPLGDLDLVPSQWSPERVRDAEQRQVAIGRHVHTALAIAPDGTVAGSSDVRVDDSDRTHGEVGITIVDPDHRGRRLGLALKLGLMGKDSRDLRKLANFNNFDRVERKLLKYY